MSSIRNSKIELFRIFAAFSVLIAHCNGWFLGGIPEGNHFCFESGAALGQSVIASLFSICVNCFILISGFFGIKLRLNSVVQFILRLAVLFVSLYLLACIAGLDVWRPRKLIHNLLPISRGGYFVQCYFMLMLISPAINLLFDNNKRLAVMLTAAFLMLEFWLDCIRGYADIGFGNGYALAHFVVIYSCGRCVALYRDVLVKPRPVVWVFAYLFFSTLTWLLYCFRAPFAFHYSNLTVIAASVCIFIPFLYGGFTSKVVNWVAGSCLTVYIMQVVNPFHQWLKNIDGYLFSTYTYPSYLLLAGGAILLFFLICVLYDNLLKVCTKPLLNSVERLLGRVSAIYLRHGE